MPLKPVLIDIQIIAPSWGRVRGLTKRLTQATEAVAAHLPRPLSFPFRATLLLAGDARVRRLNHDFRGQDNVTNVLSFPQFTPEAFPSLKKQKDPVEMGDLIIAYAYTKKEARTEGKPFLDHTTHLVIHGLLHLFGYDHTDNAKAARMEKLEIKILKSLGIGNPYAEGKRAL